MSSADRFHAVGKEPPLRRRPDWRVMQDRYIEARYGSIEMRRKAWLDHRYDCNHGSVCKHKSLEPCSLFAMYDRLSGEPQRPMPFEITDGHW